jgi:hypothetical protein
MGSSNPDLKDLPSKHIKTFLVSESLLMYQCNQNRLPTMVGKRLSTSLLFITMVVYCFFSITPSTTTKESNFPS